MRHQIHTSRRPLVMGIVNVTPDSFSDGGMFSSTSDAVAYAKKLVEAGADILDIGGESTRPGSSPVSIDEELKRVIPVVEAFANKDVLISVDTSKAEVMRQAIDAGVDMINDVNALRACKALETVAENDRVFVCLMHMQGSPANMQKNPQYINTVQDVYDFLQDRIQVSVAAGILKHRLIIDPGFGFGKTLQHNLALLNKLKCFTQLNVPILAGLSRKSMLGAMTGNAVDQRIHESVAAALLAVINGARIVRVHDVKATKDALSIFTAMQENS
ncbi:dihydropteroate synthase [Nitrosomonas aestuarii]|uniref:Dihydropteroate synthase n=1 Tax=Nitrosomonas aestuarii TaxID=52441 RepID=A0A1I4D7P9_9PROT|nr:dihydropteroate synthase [Nitrosomonas aestuarii]PTN09157.1 dihydropteroate synthase [Nitrosomonas aestuarii]SFK88166.1 Dihydropteroate synthase [Nitrosomonas aestuarii]